MIEIILCILSVIAIFIVNNFEDKHQIQKLEMVFLFFACLVSVVTFKDAIIDLFPKIKDMLIMGGETKESAKVFVYNMAFTFLKSVAYIFMFCQIIVVAVLIIKIVKHLKRKS